LDDINSSRHAFTCTAFLCSNLLSKGEVNMPVIHISLVEGRDSNKVKACVKAVAHTVAETLNAPLESIRVYATSVPKAHWAVGGQTKDETTEGSGGKP